MNPGLVVKLRPAGPWRIGPDSGARNRVDVTYHSDSLYSAVTGAMARLGTLEEWLGATARQSQPAVCFSSCFPFLDDIGFVIPPRTIWPPSSPALMSARVRWKSARFVPLGIVRALLSGQTLDGSHWSVDGPSECLVPAGKLGPFRTGVRFNAAVDRLTGATERHSTACIEFRPGSGLWTVVSFRDDASRDRWSDPVKAAFRWLADTGFGGERSRGWGRSEAPEFIEGNLPDMILPPVEPAAPVEQSAEPVTAAIESAPDITPLVVSPEPGAEFGFVPQEVTTLAIGPETVEPLIEPKPEPEGSPAEVQSAESAPAPESEPRPEDPAPEPKSTESTPAQEAAELVPEPEPAPESGEPAPSSEIPAPAVSAEPTPEPEPTPETAEPTPGPRPPAPDQSPAPETAPASHWLLSLFSPGASDAVDWQRGNYTILARGGRIESPIASGELKKQLNMVAEGSVVLANSAPCGAAPDVAPDGFAHPVFRAGFAVSIPLPHSEVS